MDRKEKRLLSAEDWRTCSNARQMMMLLEELAYPPRRRGRARKKIGAKLPDTLKGPAVARKWRLFAVTCCRWFWKEPHDSRIQQAVEVAERYADGLATQDKLSFARSAAEQARQQSTIETNTYAYAAAQAAQYCASETEFTSSHEAAMVGWYVSTSAALLSLKTKNIEPMAHAELLRDLFSNPFQSVLVEPDWLAWNEGMVRKMAQAFYDEGLFHQMPVLADALEDAGCADPEILDHCREQREHVRGCWVLDLLLGKT